MAESKEELKNLLMKMKEESKKAGLKLNIQKMKIMTSGLISLVQSLSRVWLFVTPWITAHQASLSITNSQSPPKPMSIESVMPSSVVPFSSCPQSLPASESFPISQLFTWGGQSTAVSALASFLPKKSQGWSASEWTGCISLQFRFSFILWQKH